MRSRLPALSEVLLAQPAPLPIEVTHAGCALRPAHLLIKVFDWFGDVPAVGRAGFVHLAGRMIKAAALLVPICAYGPLAPPRS